MDSGESEQAQAKNTFDLRKQILSDSTNPNFDKLLLFTNSYLAKKQEEASSKILQQPVQPISQETMPQPSILRKKVDRRGFLKLFGATVATGAGLAAGISNISSTGNSNSEQTPTSTAIPRPKLPMGAQPTLEPTTTLSKPTATAKPTETATPESTATPTFEPTSTKTPEPTSTEKPINLTKELFKPLSEDVEKTRLSKSQNPEYARRIDPEINRGRINIILMGVGGEISWGEENADAILVTSYSPSKNNLAMISLHRDTQAPEIFFEEQKKGQPIQWFDTELMRATRAGGIPLLEKILENTTGLSSDYYIKLKSEAIPIIIDKVFGKIKVNIPVDIPKDKYGLGGFTKGQQEMDGKTLLNYMQTRQSSSLERRNSAQQQVIEIAIEEFVNRLANGSNKDRIELIKKLQDVLDQLQKDKKIESDIPISKMIDNVTRNLPVLLSKMAISKILGQNGLRPSINKIVIAENNQIKRYPVVQTGPRGALESYVDPVTHKQIIFDAKNIQTALDPQVLRNYYTFPRKLVRDMITNSS